MKIIIFIVGLITDLILVWLFFWLWSKNHIDISKLWFCLSHRFNFLCFLKSLKICGTAIFLTINFNRSLVLGIIGVLAAIYIPSLNKLPARPLSFSDWRVIGGLAIINVALIEFVKYYFIQKIK